MQSSRKKFKIMVGSNYLNTLVFDLFHILKVTLENQKYLPNRHFKLQIVASSHNEKVELENFFSKCS